jgi:hypothetical protein
MSTTWLPSADQASTPHVVVHVTRVAIIGDGLDAPGDIFMGDDAGIEQAQAIPQLGQIPYRHGSRRVRFVHRGLETPADVTVI